MNVCHFCKNIENCSIKQSLKESALKAKQKAVLDLDIEVHNGRWRNGSIH